MATVAGEAVGLFCKYNAATPATCGVALEVPLMVFVAVSGVDQEESIEEPGAKMSTHAPMFEKSDLAPVEVVEPTVSTAATPPRAARSLKHSLPRAAYGVAEPSMKGRIWPTYWSSGAML